MIGDRNCVSCWGDTFTYIAHKSFPDAHLGCHRHAITWGGSACWTIPTLGMFLLGFSVACGWFAPQESMYWKLVPKMALELKALRSGAWGKRGGALQIIALLKKEQSSSEITAKPKSGLMQSSASFLSKAVFLSTCAPPSGMGWMRVTLAARTVSYIAPLFHEARSGCFYNGEI